ncbi:MAG TPA: transcriptional regulator GcvA [Burkholderiales bacterium]|nr:transcriptional regulator GcvA [Burkholderiales bacterium]
MRRAGRRSQLPPLNSLRAFEAAARHSNFRKAADELHVTPAAVSHQVKALEDHLGVQLFRRQARALELTPAAKACLPQLREGFGAFATAAELVRTGLRRETLFLKAAPSFAVKWLGRRIDRFVCAYPDIDVHIDANPRTIDGRPGDGPEDVHWTPLMGQSDVAIRFGAGKYPGCCSDKLFSVALTPMCAPSLLKSGPRLRCPQDLRRHTLLHDDTLDVEDGRSKWETWLEAAGVPGVDLTRGPHFNHAALALDAAVDGVGVVLSYPLLAAADIAGGRLVMPFDLAIPLEPAYYVVYAEAIAGQRKVSAFRNWLLEEVQKFVVSPDPGAGTSD